ncbi:MAG: type II secretion system F family protein [Thermoplasmata archaeon]
MATALPSRTVRRAVRPAPAPADDGTAGRPIRVSRGHQPAHSGLTGFQRWCWKTFQERITGGPGDPALEESILRAHLRIRGDEFRATVYGTTVVAAIGLGVAGVVAFILLDLVLGLGPLIGLLALVGLPALSGLVFVMLQGRPAGIAKTRGREIDRRISIAMNFMSAMASADVNIDQIFKELSDQQRIYGAVADEAAWISRDTELLGVDILTAIRLGAARSPSKRFQDFLQGVVTTATSGGQFKPYFLLKAEQYERENKLAQLQRTETMGLMAEVFVIGIVAFPLFLIIILAIFAIIGGNGAFVLFLLWVIVGLVIPVMEAVFIFIMHVFATEI